MTSATFPEKVSNASFYINHRNHWISAAAIAYVFIGYGVGIAALMAASGWLNLVGLLLVIHTLMWAAYFVHDFMHNAIFQRAGLNRAFGQAMLFLTGSSYCRYRDLAHHHLAHHKDRADFSAFAIADFLQALPRPLRQLIIGLEWLYFPVINFILRWLCLLTPFFSQRRRDERWRNGLQLLVRGSLFSAIAIYSPRAVLLYFLAYLAFIHILRFMDCFQHTYTVFRLDQPLPRYDLAHEELNTFSNVLTQRWPWLNLIFLNFGYHNAHHRVVRCPWYLLPALDRELYRPDYRQVVTLPRLIANYHRFRVHRLFHGQGEVVDEASGVSLHNFVGAIGVSFLVLRDPIDWLPLNL